MLDSILTRKVIAPIVIVLVGILVYLFLHSILKRSFKVKIGRMDDRKRVTILKLIDNISKYFIIIVCILLILGEFGVDTKSLVASLGVVGVVIGLALQDTLKDFVSGLFIITEDQYRVGDTITVGGFKGEVVSLGLKTTKVKAYTGEIKIIANHNINEVINHSLEESLAIVDVSVAYESDLEQVEAVLKNVAERLSNELSDLKEPIEVLGIESLDDSGICYRLTATTVAMKQYGIQRRIRKEIKQEFDAQKITIPYPQVVIHHA